MFIHSKLCVNVRFVLLVHHFGQFSLIDFEIILPTEIITW